MNSIRYCQLGADKSGKVINPGKTGEKLVGQEKSWWGRREVGGAKLKVGEAPAPPAVWETPPLAWIAWPLIKLIWS